MSLPPWVARNLNYDSEPPPFKQCGCGRKYTVAEWGALPIRGHIDVPEDGHGPSERLQLRNCSRCGSTIAVGFTES
jgi:hypothetical protein